MVQELASVISKMGAECKWQSTSSRFWPSASSVDGDFPAPSRFVFAKQEAERNNEERCSAKNEIHISIREGLRLLLHQVVNLTLRKMFRERLVLQVTYDTSRERLETFARRLQQLIEEHPTADKTTIRVRFNDFGESSLNILVIFHLVVADGAAELEERETLLLQFIDLAQELGVEFAFPTRTLHVETAPSPGGGVNAEAKAGASGAARRGPIGLVE